MKRLVVMLAFGMLAFGLGGSPVSAAETTAPVDAAERFGARERTGQVSLSLAGHSVAWVGPCGARGSAVYTLAIDDKAAKPQLTLVTSGEPDRLESCSWVSNKRVACLLYGVVKQLDVLSHSRWIAADAGGNMRMLACEMNSNTRCMMLGDGDIIDLLPDGENSVLMARLYLPDGHVGSRMGSDNEGLGVDRVDTATLRSLTVEMPRLGVESRGFNDALRHLAPDRRGSREQRGEIVCA